MNPFIGIYQPFYKPALAEFLDDGFVALDWLKNPFPGFREFAIHRYIATEKKYEKHCLTGVFSPKFFAKTNLSSHQVFDWVTRNPGFDLYLINGGPFSVYETYNGIERNKKNHTPAFETEFRAFCNAIALELPMEFPRQTLKNYCACNFWIGSRAFWERWSKEVIFPISELVKAPVGIDRFLRYAKYPAPQPVYLLAFLYERLVDYYVAQRNINAIYYPWDESSMLAMDCHPSIKAYLKKMIPLVDVIDERGIWTEREKLWLRECYAAVTREIGALARNRGFAASETLVNSPIDYDLPSRYPKCGPMN